MIRIVSAIYCLLLTCPVLAEPPRAVLSRMQYGGTIGFRTTGSLFDAYDWAISPPEAEPELWRIRMEDGEPAAICFRAPPYVVVFGAMRDGELALAIEQVEGDAPPPTPPPPDPPPGPEPPPPADDWATWTHKSAEAHVPQVGRRGAAIKLADAIEALCSRTGDYQTPRKFREATKQTCHDVLGEGTPADKAWTAWSNDYLEPWIVQQLAVGRLNLDSVAGYAAFYLKVAQGLRRVDAGRVPTPAKRPPAQPRPFHEGVQLVMFGADWCRACKTMTPVLKELRDSGYPVWWADADTPANLAILRQQQISRIPAYLMYRDGRVVSRSTGVRSRGFLVEWITKTQGD